MLKSNSPLAFSLPKSIYCLTNFRCPSIKNYLESLGDFLSARDKAENTYFDEVEKEI